VRLIRGSRALERPLRHAVVTVGNFDGLHVGHQEIMRIVIERARARGGEAAVYTFDPHPRRVLHPERAPRLLATLEQKLELLEQAGVDVAIVEPFTTDFARMPAEAFVRQILWERIQPEEVYVGYDFHYGRDREGSMRTLTELGPHLGFAVTIVPEVTVGHHDVNSTRIRELLDAARVAEAATLLGRPYRIWAEVVPGDRRGRTLGFPTLNLDPDNEILPRRGVYAGRVKLLDGGVPERGSVWPAVTNVGVRPTFGGDAAPIAEAHLIDFEGDLYGRRVELSFLQLLREERKFPGVEELKVQISADVADARRMLAEAG